MHIYMHTEIYNMSLLCNKHKTNYALQLVQSSYMLLAVVISKLNTLSHTVQELVTCTCYITYTPHEQFILVIV